MYSVLYNDISGAAYSAQILKRPTEPTGTLLYNSDFGKPLVINKPGVYKLGENIKLNFYPMSYDIFDVEQTGNDLFGFSAGIKILTTNVILDLNGFTIVQSPQDFCVQRFFSIIQLNNSPFVMGAGPIPESYKSLITAERCIIRNGTLGLSSHQAILGNNNKNIILENLNLKDFEVTGITLNRINTLFMKNVNIMRSIGIERFLPVSPYFSTLIWNYRLLKLTFIKFYITSIEQHLILEINNHIRSILSQFLHIIYTNTSLTVIYNQLLQITDKAYPYLKFLFNESKKSPCGVHGFKITGPRPTITKFHESIADDVTLEKSTNINIVDCSINKLIAEITPKINITYNNKLVHIGAGLKLTSALLAVPVIYHLAYTMNILGKNKALTSFLQTTVNDDIIDFIKMRRNTAGKIGFDTAYDMMGHINKGVMALRLGCSKTIKIKNVEISDIVNEGLKIDPKELEWYKCTYGIRNVTTASDTFLSPMSYHGAYAMGAIISGSEDCDISNCNISEIKSPHGAAVGLAINNICKNIDISNTKVTNLLSCITCFDSATFVIDEKSENINTKNFSFNPTTV